MSAAPAGNAFLGGVNPEDVPPPVPRLLGDPALELCPRFGSAAYDDMILAVAEKRAISKDDAIAQAVALWQGEHDERLQQWATQQQHDLSALDDADAALRAQAETLELAEQDRLRAVIDKRRPTFAPVDMAVGISNETTHFLSQWIVEKLTKGHLVPLYHFLPDSRLEALTSARSAISTGAYVLEHTDEGGIGIRQQSEMASSKKVIPDDNLTWRQIQVAKNVLLDSLKRALWPTDHIQIWATFYARLEAHDLHQEAQGERLLIRYHADARRQWHDKLLNENVAFDIGTISTKRLEALEGVLRREDDTAREQRSLAQVTFVLLEATICTC